MKIAFVDLVQWNYSIQNVKEIPLGGSQSALCYLAMTLAELGHNIFLLNNITSPQISCGVSCLPVNSVNVDFWSQVDFIIVLNLAGYGKIFKNFCGSSTQLILWNQHSYDQPSIQALADKEEKNSYDYFVFISEWQKENFIQEFELDPQKILILRNSISPVFENLFDLDEKILTAKTDSPVLVYTSTPFRGLELLLDIFPKIQSEHPDVKLRIYSSMKVYQVSESEDESMFGKMYNQFRGMLGVEYIGSLPQPQLAKELKKASILTYPNTFAETSCIAVMEAMASGCYVITSNLGALPETTSGYGTLVSLENGFNVYKDKFIQETVDFLHVLKSQSRLDIENRLRKQINFCNEFYTWRFRAHQWLQQLYKIQAYKYFTDQNYSLAINVYQNAIKAYPDVIEYYYYLMLCWILSNEDEQALSVILFLTKELLPNSSEDVIEKLNIVIAKEVELLRQNYEETLAQKIEKFFAFFE